MKHMAKKSGALAALLLLTLPSLALADNPADRTTETTTTAREQEHGQLRDERPARSSDARAAMKNESTSEEPMQLVRDSSDVLRRFTKDANPRISKDLLARARCVAVFPDLVKGAVVVGGRHGDGVVTCKTVDGRWSQLAFVDLTGASLGAQIGGESTDMILLFLSEKAQKKLVDGRITLGADANVTAGDRGLAIGTELNRSDVVAINDRAGLFAGAALDGTLISADEDQNKAQYKESKQLSQILSSAGTSGVSQEVQNLIELLPSGSARES